MSLRNDITFNSLKFTDMIFKRPVKGMVFEKNGEALEIVDNYKYLGVALISQYVTDLFRNNFSEILERAWVKVAAIRSYGFHEDGLSIQSSIRLYKLVIRPLLEYCTQTLTYSMYSRASHPDAILPVDSKTSRLRT